MSDLISRQAAIDEAEEWIEAVYCEHTEQRERDAIKHVINGIKKLPSVPYTDAEVQKMQDMHQAEVEKAFELGQESAKAEIVRCKDCRHSEHWYGDKSRCFLWHEEGIDVFEDGFCSYAERRTE